MLPLFLSLIQPLWRFTDSQIDDRVLVYRSEDIKNLSRLGSPKVCGYIHGEANDLLPQIARRNWDGQEEVEQEKGELCFSAPRQTQRVLHVPVCAYASKGDKSQIT